MSNTHAERLAIAERLGTERGRAYRAATLAEGETPTPDAMPAWLSGEWADDPTQWEMVVECGLYAPDDCETYQTHGWYCGDGMWCSLTCRDYSWQADALAEAYEDAADAAYLTD